MRIFAIAAAFGLLTLPALGAPTAEQKAEFYAVCMGIAQDETLCSCKADAAMKLVDEDFMGIIISSMKGKAPPTADNLKYAEYIGQSNKVCKPNY